MPFEVIDADAVTRSVRKLCRDIQAVRRNAQRVNDSCATAELPEPFSEAHMKALDDADRALLNVELVWFQ